MGLTIKTAASADLRRPRFGKRAGLFYGLLLPFFFAEVLFSGRGPLLRGLRILALLSFLGLVAIWVGCGGTGGGGTGNNGNGGGGGTPTGSYVVTVSATSGSLRPSTTITLTVQ